MTFEQQVEEALAHAFLMPREGEGYSAYYRRAMDMLAPRVAAAIEAYHFSVFGNTWTSEWEQGTPSPHEEAQIKAWGEEAALAALRGGPPRDPE